MLKHIRLVYENRNSFNCNRLSTGEYSRALKSERSTILYTEIYLEMFYELLISFSTTDITAMMYTCLRKCDFNGCSVPVWNLIDSWKLCFQMLFSINFRDTEWKKKDIKNVETESERHSSPFSYLTRLLMDICRLCVDINNGSFFLIGWWIYSFRKLKTIKQMSEKKYTQKKLHTNTWRAGLLDKMFTNFLHSRDNCFILEKYWKKKQNMNIAVILISSNFVEMKW